MNKSVLIVGNAGKNIGGISMQIKLLYSLLKKEKFNVGLFNTKQIAIIRIFLIVPLLYKARKFDIIHIHGCSYFGFFPIVIGSLVGWVLSKRIIITYHGGAAEYFLKKHYWWARIFLNLADEITVMSGFLKKAFCKFHIKTTELSNIIEFPCTSFMPKFDYPRMISIRSLTSLYNVDKVILAFHQVKKRFPQATLTVVGDGDQKAVLISLVKKLNVRDVKFKGQISNEMIRMELEKSNIFVSLPNFDNQPVSVIESFSAGIPVISTNVGGMQYLIENKKNGYLVDKNDSVYQVLDIVSEIMNKKNIYSLIGNAKETAASYTWPRVKIKLLNIYSNKIL